MKKYLMMGATALVFATGFTSCSKEENLYDPDAAANQLVEQYRAAFIKVFGEPAEDQEWGFGKKTAESRLTRSQVAPVVNNIVAPYDEEWVANYVQTAKEPNEQNAVDNFDNSRYERKEGTYTDPYATWYTEFEAAYPQADYGWDWNKTVAAAQADGWEHFNDLFTVIADETFVLDFKITDTWNGDIAVVATEGLVDGVANGFERTVVVTGTWNITSNQRVGSKGRIIIANGGTVNVAEGVTLNMVNQARLVVLRGGKLTGAGKVEVNNGNAAGEENYNAGTIDVAVFNNNFGKFYNYGEFLVNEYHGGAEESNFYNHALVNIDHFGVYDSSTANARIFNNCQFYVQNNARIRNYEGVGGSALIVGGELMFSSSEDGTNDPTYVGLAEGALVKCATLYNNGTSWTGPTSGYAALEVTDQITYLNWEQDAPQTGGYFENNIYVKSATWTNVPDGNGYHQTDPTDAANYAVSIADYKFFSIIANCRGNGGVKKVNEGSTELLPADEDFALGVRGCTPGFTGDIPTVVIEANPAIRIFAEDLSASTGSDFDFNDVVLDAIYVSPTQALVKVWAAGGTLPLQIASMKGETYGGGFEVHEEFGVDVRCMVNTHAKPEIKAPGYTAKDELEPYVRTITLPSNIAEILNLQEGDPTEFDKDNFAWSVNKLIRIEVNKGGWYELDAAKGVPACKIAGPETTDATKTDWGCRWLLERRDIRVGYPDFKSYVGNGYPRNWWDNEVNGLMYAKTQEPKGFSVICDEAAPHE